MLVLISALIIIVGTSSGYTSEYVRIQGDQFVFRGQVVKLKGTNYYPRDHMWADIWNSWDWQEMVNDATRIKNLGLNCVRILVPYSAGGWGGANPPADRLQKLEDLVNLFGDNGIRSCITLFDWETSFPAAGTLKERDHLSYLSAIVNKLKNNEYVFMWDVKNEPDHPANIGGYDNWDANPSQRDKIVNWLQRMCAAVRSIDTNHPVSVGIRWWENVQDVIGFVDIAIFHSYWPNVNQQIIDIRSYMGSNQKPILCQEFGWPTNPKPCNRDGQLVWNYTESEQLNVYTNHLTAFSSQGIAGCLQWMTYDARPYTSDPNVSFENYFGLWRYDYSLKPAGVYYRDHFPVSLFPPRDKPPGPITNFTATPTGPGIRLSWTNPSDEDFAGTIIRVSTSGYPADPESGDLVCDKTGLPGSTDSFIHTNVQPCTTYFYSAFAYDQSRKYSVVAKTSATPGHGCLALIKQLPDGTWVAYSGAVVSAVFNEDGCIYIQTHERTCGLRVVATNTGLVPGDIVNVSGYINTRWLSGQRSERQVTNASVNKVGSGAAPEPVCVTGRFIGGAPVGLMVPGVVGGLGLNNMGLLVKISGRVSARVGNYFWLDDGSGILDIMGRVGVMVRCLFDPGVLVGQMVSCVGVVEGSVPTGWVTNRRCVHARSILDIHTY
ncbi:MAG: cellulase family glycosylhydrolase [Armatimonadota bacterium]